MGKKQMKDFREGCKFELEVSSTFCRVAWHENKTIGFESSYGVEGLVPTRLAMGASSWNVVLAVV